MLNFFHSYSPSPVIFQIGRIVFHWYGLFIILGIIFGIAIILKLSKLYQVEKERIFDLSFFLVIFGIIGARLFDIFYNWRFFLDNPLDIIKIWQGGLSIHGAIIAGLIVLFFYCRKYKFSFWLFSDLMVPGLVLGQAIGRWGNYFNQELYGSPTNLFFGIPIALKNRIVGFESFDYFHPVFLYEFIFNLIIFGILIWLHKRSLKVKKSLDSSAGSFGYSPSGELLQDEPTLLVNQKSGLIFLVYLILYSSVRFFIEFLRIDIQPIFLNLRLAQWISLLIVVSSLVIIINKIPCFHVFKVFKKVTKLFFYKRSRN